MKSLFKVSNVTIVLAIATALVFSQVPLAHSEKSINTKNALLFLADVAELDTSKYDARLISTIPLPSTSDSNEIAVVYSFTSDGNELEAICHLRNSIVSWCKLYPIVGSPLFVKTKSNALDASKSFLSKYQSYSGISYLQPIRNALNTVSELTPMTKTVGDIRLVTAVEGNIESIKWMNLVNGIPNTYNIMVLRFRDGAFEFFCDEWNRYSVGNADVKTSREEAIRVAKEQARNRIKADVGIEAASDFAFTSETATLTMQARGNALYPHWEVLLTLDRMVLGYGSAFRASVWADTGEVPYMTYSGSYGFAESDENSTSSPGLLQFQSQQSTAVHSSPLLPEKTNQSTDLSVIAGMAAIAMLTAIVASVALKRRSK